MFKRCVAGECNGQCGDRVLAIQFAACQHLPAVLLLGVGMVCAAINTSSCEHCFLLPSYPGCLTSKCRYCIKWNHVRGVLCGLEKIWEAVWMQGRRIKHSFFETVQQKTISHRAAVIRCMRSTGFIGSNQS